MTAFADSSALVKLYADEDGHEAVRALATMVISQIARVEVPAALWRKHRLGEIPAEAASVLTADFEADYYGTADAAPRFATFALNEGVLDSAATVAARHGLRAYDAVQLSTAILFRGIDADCSDFVAFDRDLRAAASAEGFQVVPAVLPA